jgi:hypothetical protein
VTELDANTSAITYWVSESDGWHVVTTVDVVMGQPDDAKKTRSCAFFLVAAARPVTVDLSSRCHRRATTGSAHPPPRRPDRGGAVPGSSS